jgi:hypothetical protein
MRMNRFMMDWMCDATSLGKKEDRDFGRKSVLDVLYGW